MTAPVARAFTWGSLVVFVAVVSVVAQQSFTGTLSETTCGSSHQPKAAAAGLTDRQCLFVCIKTLSQYALVDQNKQVRPIVNQDTMGLPLYAGRPVRLTGESKADAIFVTRVEAIAAHLHLGHVMTNWRDTPGTRGFLPVAIEEAKIAVVHARLAAKSESLDDIRLHIGHVLHALDPAIEPKGPGTGYGLKRAAAGAEQHLELAAKGEGATANVLTHAAQVSASLASVRQWVDQAVAAAQKTRAAAGAADAARLAAGVVALTVRISEEGLNPAESHMTLLLKAEGILGAPR